MTASNMAAFFKNNSLKPQFLVFVDFSRGRGCVITTIWFPTFEYAESLSAGEGEQRQASEAVALQTVVMSFSYQEDRRKH